MVQEQLRNEIINNLSNELTLGQMCINCGKSNAFASNVRLEYLQIAKSLYEKIKVSTKEIEKIIKTVYLPYSPITVANTFIDMAKRNNRLITVMKVEKLVYYAHGWTLALHDKELFHEKIIAEEYGPIIHSIIEEFCRYGLDPIQGYGIEKINNMLLEPYISTDDPFLPFLEDIWDVYGKYSDIALSNMSCASNSPWDNAKNKTPYTIPSQKLKDYFLSLGALGTDIT